ncbi:hypothetical protein I4U23_025210 [Adineta vaga]|nr:hypothetical protein I4U23_025210 [Adineta vaga]
MLDYFIYILIGNYLLFSTTGLIIHTQRTKDNEEICVQNHLESRTNDHLLVCHINNNRDRSILIWFKIDRSLFKLFHFYRFILRTVDEITLTTNHLHLLTNFTDLIDRNNSLRIFNLNSGHYEICVDFQSNMTSYIYSPRNACISIRIGELLRRSFKQSSTQLFIALITGIIAFLLLALIVQIVKSKQIERTNQEQIINEDKKKHSRRSSILSSVFSKKQRLFRRYIDQPDPSQMRQWARNRAFRHRISTHENDHSRWNRSVPTITMSQKNSALTNQDIYIIPINECSRQSSYYLTPSEQLELL